MKPLTATCLKITCKTFTCHWRLEEVCILEEMERKIENRLRRIPDNLTVFTGTLEFVDDLCLQRYLLLNQTNIGGLMDLIQYIMQFVKALLEVDYGKDIKYLNAIYYDLEGLEEVTDQVTSASFSNILHTITLPDREFCEHDFLLIDSLLLSYRHITSGGYALELIPFQNVEGR
jgi:hypothetical protein